MNDDLQLHYGKYWADEMNMTEEEIVEQIKKMRYNIFKREMRKPFGCIKLFLGIRSPSDLVTEDYYYQLEFFESMLKARKADKHGL